MIMRFIACEAGYVHIIGSCPNCYHAQGGLLLGTVANNYAGRVHTVCMDCDMTVDYYIDAKEEKLWKLESVETKGSPSKSPQTIVKEARKLETQIMAKEAEKLETQIIAKEAEKPETQIIAREAEKLETQIIAKEAEKLQTQIMAKEAEKLETEVSNKVSMFA